MNVTAFLKVLPVIGNGMLGIFIVLIVIMFFVMALNKIFKGKDEDKQ